MRSVAARRLIALLLVLLFLSSLAAALAPVQDGMRDGSSTGSDSTGTAEAPIPPEADTAEERRLVTESVQASGERPAVVRLRVGDRLRLTVKSRRSGTVELENLGQAEDVGPNQPAYFDVLPRDDGTFPVRFIASGREVARIEVSSPRTPASLR